MISDFQVLGIETTTDLALIKAAYRKRVKQLHPDTAASSLSASQKARNSLLMVEVCKAYRNLVSVTVTDQNAPTVNRSPDANKPSAMHNSEGSRSSLIRHKDPAYVYYKRGITLFYRIHPSQWTKGGERETVLSLASLFPRAYHFFTLVADQYPESVWAQDAVDKMALIEERMRLYKSIIESFEGTTKNLSF